VAKEPKSAAPGPPDNERKSSASPKLHSSEFHPPLPWSKFLIGGYRGGLVHVRVGIFAFGFGFGFGDRAI
jgi:hypothetical protein